MSASNSESIFGFEPSSFKSTYSKLGGPNMSLGYSGKVSINMNEGSKNSGTQIFNSRFQNQNHLRRNGMVMMS